MEPTLWRETERGGEGGRQRDIYTYRQSGMKEERQNNITNYFRK